MNFDKNFIKTLQKQDRRQERSSCMINRVKKIWKEPKSVVEIALKNICKEYKNKNYAVRDFNLDIYDKEFVILLDRLGVASQQLFA